MCEKLSPEGDSPDRWSRLTDKLESAETTIAALTQRAEQAERTIRDMLHLWTDSDKGGIIHAKIESMPIDKVMGYVEREDELYQLFLNAICTQRDIAEAEVKRLEAKLAQSTNYVADDDTYPHVVWFANGRKVWIESGGHLGVALVDVDALLAQPSDKGTKHERQ